MNKSAAACAFRPTNTVAGFAVGFAATDLALQVFFIFAGPIIGLLTTGMKPGENPVTDRALEIFVLTVSGLVTAIFFGGVVSFLFWVLRSNANLKSLGAEHTRFSPAWSVIVFLFPFVNLIAPYFVMSEIWKSSDPQPPGAGVEEWVKQRHSKLVLGWWSTIILYSILAIPTQFMAIRASFMMMVALRIIIDITTIRLIRKIVRMQALRHERMEPQDRVADAGAVMPVAVGLPAAGPPASPLLWTFPTGGEVNSTPAFANGVLFFGSDDGNLYALDAEGGSERWRLKCRGTVDGIITVNGGSAGTDAMATGGRVYFGSGAYSISAADADTGKLLWSRKAAPGITVSPMLYGGYLLFGANDKHIRAIEPATGEEVWRFRTGKAVAAAGAGCDSTVYFGCLDKNIYALDATTGVLRWQTRLGGVIDSPPAVTGGLLGCGSRDENVYALDAKTGVIRWTCRTGGIVSSRPAITKDSLYVGSQDGTFYAIDADSGVILWAVTVGEPIFSSPALGEDFVCFGGYDSNVHVLNRSTGALLSRFITGGWIRSSPAVSGDRIFIGSADHSLYALRSCPPPDGSAPQPLKTTETAG